MEIGYSEIAIRRCDVPNTKSAPEPQEEKVKEYKRIDAKRTILSQKLQSVPTNNSHVSDFDYEAEIRSIRSLYLQCSLPIEPFLKAVETREQKNNDW